MASKGRQYFYNVSRETMLADKAAIAETFLERLQGLLFKPPLAPGQGLYIRPCPSIHMFGMKYAIDAVFIDEKGLVVGLVENIKPGGTSRYYRSSRGCLELPAGTICATNTTLGDQIVSGDAKE